MKESAPISYELLELPKKEEAEADLIYAAINAMDMIAYLKGHMPDPETAKILAYDIAMATQELEKKD